MLLDQSHSQCSWELKGSSQLLSIQKDIHDCGDSRDFYSRTLEELSNTHSQHHSKYNINDHKLLGGLSGLIASLW